MGRGKSLDVEPRQTEELDSVAHKVCAICADKVEREEEFLRGEEFLGARPASVWAALPPRTWYGLVAGPEPEARP